MLGPKGENLRVRKALRKGTVHCRYTLSVIKACLAPPRASRDAFGSQLNFIRKCPYQAKDRVRLLADKIRLLADRYRDQKLEERFVPLASVSNKILLSTAPSPRVLEYRS
jgi:hypothetical protein